MRITIDFEAIEAMKADALEAYPDECCGFLYGTEVDGRIIRVAQPVINSKEGSQRRRFEISGQDYLAAEQFAEAHSWQLLGVYHSHPDHPAIPSIHDLRQAMPFFSYIILSVKKGKLADLRSWQLTDNGQFAEETLEKDLHTQILEMLNQ